jgi:hypothetical protein
MFSPESSTTYGRKALCLQGFIPMVASDAIAATSNGSHE